MHQTSNVEKETKTFQRNKSTGMQALKEGCGLKDLMLSDNGTGVERKNNGDKG